MESAGAQEPAAAAEKVAEKVAERNAVVRVVSVLDALSRADERGVGVRELAAGTGISRSAVQRVLAQLADLGYAGVLPRDRYEAGPAALAWSALMAADHTLADAAAEALAGLAEQWDESAYVVGYDAAAGDVAFLGAAHSTKPVRYLLELGSHAPLHAGAAGKAVLAELPPGTVDSLRLERWTEGTITDVERLRADLAESRERGWAWSAGERIADAIGVAAPLFRDGEVAGAITLTVPRYRFDPADREGMGRSVVAAAAATTRLLSPGSGRVADPA